MPVDKPNDPGAHMSKRVAILLVRHLSKALRRRRIEAVDSEPFWLTPEQYEERDGGIQLLPEMAGDMIAYSQRNHLRPLGVVVVNEDGEYFDFFNDEAIISPIDREFAEKLFRAHAHFWFCEIPWLIANKRPDA
jgi:hypothetical protein